MLHPEFLRFLVGIKIYNIRLATVKFLFVAFPEGFLDFLTRRAGVSRE